MFGCWDSQAIIKIRVRKLQDKQSGVKMGQIMETEIVVATLNYSGILLSPFQFYSEDHKKNEAALSRIFEDFMKDKFADYSREGFKWDLGKIDQKMQRERYTPIYNKAAGIQNNKLLTEQQFIKKWDKEFESNIKYFSDLGIQDKHKERARQFDLMSYKTIFFFVYKGAGLESAKQKDPKDYKKFMEEMFEKAFLNEQKKVQKTVMAIEREEVDVVFLQEANEQIAKGFDKTRFKIVYSESKESMIIIRKSKFNNIYDEQEVLKALGPEINQALVWNKDKCIAFADNLILVSGHLSSKKEKAEEDRSKMLNGCQRLLQIYPNSHLIVGVDANQFLKTIPSTLHIFPNKPSVNTAYKKRTMMQPQVNKAQVQVGHCIDFLITDMNMRRPKVVSILGKEAHSVGYLPCEEHPYDHFVVTANVYPNEK